MKILSTISFLIITFCSVGQQSTAIYFITADYCGFCTKMKKNLFNTDYLIQLNKKSIKYEELDLNSTEPILFMDSIYNYEPTGINQGQNTLFNTIFAEEQPTVPFILIVNNGNINAINGYIETHNFEKVLNSIIENNSTEWKLNR